jgi:hypothetical protein
VLKSIPQEVQAGTEGHSASGQNPSICEPYGGSCLKTVSERQYQFNIRKIF